MGEAAGSRLAKLTAIFSIQSVIYISYIPFSNDKVSSDGSVWTMLTSHMQASLQAQSKFREISSIDGVELVKLHHHIRGPCNNSIYKALG